MVHSSFLPDLRRVMNSHDGFWTMSYETFNHTYYACYSRQGARLWEPLVSLKWNNWQAIFFNRGHSFAIQELPDRENVFSLTLGGRWLTGSWCVEYCYLHKVKLRFSAILLQVNAEWKMENGFSKCKNRKRIFWAIPLRRAGNNGCSWMQ